MKVFIISLILTLFSFGVANTCDEIVDYWNTSVPDFEHELVYELDLTELSPEMPYIYALNTAIANGYTYVDSIRNNDFLFMEMVEDSRWTNFLTDLFVPAGQEYTYLDGILTTGDGIFISCGIVFEYRY